MSEDRTPRGHLDLPPLPDHLRPGLVVVFIGYNPGETSARVGHYYAYPGNRFWWLLWQSGLTERRLSPDEDASLLDRGYGLTDLVDRPSKGSSSLAAWEKDVGRALLLDKLERNRPRIACYNGKGVYAAAAGVARTAYGFKATSLVAGVRDFVAASPSGRSREPLAVKLSLYRDLAAALGG